MCVTAERESQDIIPVFHISTYSLVATVTCILHLDLLINTAHNSVAGELAEATRYISMLSHN